MSNPAHRHSTGPPPFSPLIAAGLVVLAIAAIVLEAAVQAGAALDHWQHHPPLDPLGLAIQLADHKTRWPHAAAGLLIASGAIVILLAALSGCQPLSRRAVRVFLTADEEIGSPTARDLLARAADGAAAAFVCEPPTLKGDLKTARKGLGRFSIHVTGRASHAGEPLDGVSAIDELARLTLKLHALTDRATGVSVNVGVVSGGTRENVVAAEATALIDVSLNLLNGTISSLLGLSLIAIRTPLSVFWSTNRTISLTALLRPPSNSHFAPARRQPSR